MVQGEPRKEDIVIQVDNINFAVEDYYEEMINSFDVDYANNIFKRGFVVYPNGQKASC